MLALKRKSKFLDFQYQKNRLESFHKAVLLGKAKKLVAWPDTDLDSDSLSSLGFFYHPTLQHKDQMQCFCCTKKVHGLKGLSEDDILRKMDCNYSKLMRFLRKNEFDSVLNDPADNDSIKMRIATFDNFPHSNPTPESLAKAGFIFTPATSDDDSTTCIYCLCVLDSWGYGDDPLIEHRVRNSKCPVFNSESNPPSDVEEGRAKSPLKVTENSEALSDDDFDKVNDNPWPNSSQTSKPTNRYGSSKIKKNKMVTSSSNPSSSFVVVSQQRSKTEERRSWYRNDTEKKRKSQEMLSDEDNNDSPSKRSRDPDADDSSLMEISAIEESPIINTEINGESVQNIIDSTFAVPVPSLPTPEFSADLEMSVAEFLLLSSPKRDSPKKINTVKKRSTRRLLPSKLSENMVEKQGLLDVIDHSASSQLHPSSEFSVPIFDHHDEEMFLEENPEENVDEENVSKLLSPTRNDDPPTAGLLIQKPKENCFNDDTEEIKVKRRGKSNKVVNHIEEEGEEEKIPEPTDALTSQKMNAIESQRDQSNKKNEETKQEVAPVLEEIFNDHDHEDGGEKNNSEEDQTETLFKELEEGRAVETLTENVLKENTILLKDADKSDQKNRLSIAEIIEEENQTIYADRRRTRSSMAPYSPNRTIKKNDQNVDIERRTEDKLLNKEKKLTKKKVTKKVLKKGKESSLSKSKKTRSSNAVEKKEKANESDTVPNELDLSELDTIPQKSSQSSRRPISSGSIIGSPELNSNTSRNQKRISLMKMMKERNSKLFNSSQKQDDSIDSKDLIRVKDKRRDSFLISKSPGKSPLKLNKLIDVEESGDIFSQSSPVRIERRREKSFGIDKLAQEIGKEILGDIPSLTATNSPSPKLELKAVPRLLPNSPQALPTQPRIITKASHPLVGNEEDHDEEEYHPLENPTNPIKVIAKRSSTENLEAKSTSSSPNPLSSSKRSSQGPALRSSILPAISPERPTVKSPVASATFEISKIDDDVILADDDIKSGENTYKFSLIDKIGFEESSRRTSKLSPKIQELALSSPVRDVKESKLDPSPSTDALEAQKGDISEKEDTSNDGIQIPGVLDEFNDTLGYFDEEPKGNQNRSDAAHNESDELKSSTPLKLITAEAESTSLELVTLTEKRNSLQSPQAERKLDGTVNKLTVDDADENMVLNNLELKWKPSERTVLNQIIADIESSGEFLTKITSSRYESLHEDLDGELTSFISQMPDEELDMTIKEWIFHNAKQLKELLDLNLSQMLDLFKKEGERLLKALEELPVKDDEDDDHDNDND